ncbi:Baeyer-Villiger monooxygenase [Zhongshania aliphaticivorans]|uniref:Baeyer-Villiger monooxygenase n=1 Tax=Zhongshania aliphaticivorans TaxID=1470434 RepID=A0A5S9Q2S0_9GAMM|nr:NAD(P)/FAD-dependent oxidoreductase [Zhongshania aliphaticivorans]CAA0093542.1 Baeyer-Villiger monooxygenase [Zhongshania aliphaticivorans]CAA0111504.1 Baeyer-Villiger monooxygenase [Zhongshania aliphaticivorans]
MSNKSKNNYQVAIIGTGFGGLGMAYYLKKSGIDNFLVLEKGEDVGGVWRENTYPGAGCDVPSHFYSWSFEPHYPWQYRYGKHYEIKEYMRFVSRKYDIYSHIKFKQKVIAANFDEQRAVWVIHSASGEIYEADILISAVGQLHRPSIPNIPGQDKFKGTSFHSATWNHDFDMSGKQVAVIGTGASAVQFVPEIAKRVEKLHVFQRSPGWVGPKVEKAFSGWQRWLLDHIPLIHDIDRLRIFLLTEALGYAYRGHRWAERLLTVMSKLQLRIQVKDPDLRARLTPDYPIGCKRLLLTTEWLRALTRQNVNVVTEGITEITAEGVRGEDGVLHKVDAIVYGTGFAATEFLAPMQVTGKNGELLHERWAKGANAYLGMAVSGFPNFFTLYGPNSNLGSGSIVYMLERQQRYLAKLLIDRRDRSWDVIDVQEKHHLKFNEEIRKRSEGSTFEGDCQSWYKTAEGVNTNNWVGSMCEYSRRTAKPNFDHYDFEKIK